MDVKLVSVTQSEIDNIILSPEELIVYTARVSNPSNQANTETASKLLKYCINNKHWSPFEMVDMTVEINTTLSIAQQILRHRSASFQQYSGRYSVLEGMEIWNARRQDSKNRQNSVDDLSDEIKDKFIRYQKEVWDFCSSRYQELLSDNVAKECARNLLPVGTKTRMYMKASVRTWIHYFQVRLDPSSQKEHRDVAAAIFSVFSSKFPVISDIIKSNETNL